MSRLIRLSCIVVAWAVAAPLVQAVPTLWTGPTTNYTQPSPHSATVAACQDRLTANVWLTRNSSQPMLKRGQERDFVQFQRQPEGHGVGLWNAEQLSIASFHQLGTLGWAAHRSPPGRSAW